MSMWLHTCAGTNKALAPDSMYSLLLKKHTSIHLFDHRSSPPQLATSHTYTVVESESDGKALNCFDLTDNTLSIIWYIAMLSPCAFHMLGTSISPFFELFLVSSAAGHRHVMGECIFRALSTLQQQQWLTCTHLPSYQVSQKSH